MWRRMPSRATRRRRARDAPNVVESKVVDGHEHKVGLALGTGFRRRATGGGTHDGVTLGPARIRWRRGATGLRPGAVVLVRRGGASAGHFARRLDAKREGDDTGHAEQQRAQQQAMRGGIRVRLSRRLGFRSDLSSALSKPTRRLERGRQQRRDRGDGPGLRHPPCTTYTNRNLRLVTPLAFVIELMSRALRALLACAPLALAHVPRPPAFSLKTATTDASTLLVDKVKEANEKYGLDRKIAPFKDAIFAVGSSLGLPFPGVWHMRKKHRKGGGAIYGKKRRADKKDTSETAETIQVWWFHREWVRRAKLLSRATCG